MAEPWPICMYDRHPVLALGGRFSGFLESAKGIARRLPILTAAPASLGLLWNASGHGEGRVSMGYPDSKTSRNAACAPRLPAIRKSLRDVARRFAPAFLVPLLVLVGPTDGRAQDVPVELELVLLADSSSSIQGDEFDLQIGGYATAFHDPGVIAAIEALGGNGIAVTFVQWSASFQQIDSVGWTHIRGADDSRRFGSAIAAQARRFKGFGTGTGAALEYGAALFANNGYAGRRRVIDITSDEHSNTGPHPKDRRDMIVANWITINGLAILDDSFDLEGYFRRYVIGGPGAFVMAVGSYRDFAEAIKLKLIREISDDSLAGGATAPPRERG